MDSPRVHLPRVRSFPSIVPAPAVSRGLYEVQTGIVAVHLQPSAAPSRSSEPPVGALKSGVRFFGEGPYQVGDKMWLKVEADNYEVPRFSTDDAPPVVPNRVSFASDDMAMNVYKAARRGGMAPLPAFAPPRPDVCQVWVEDNKQYIRRLRDVSHLADKFQSVGIKCGVGPLKAAHKEMMSTRRRRGPAGGWTHSGQRPLETRSKGFLADVNFMRHSVADARYALD